MTFYSCADLQLIMNELRIGFFSPQIASSNPSPFSLDHSYFMYLVSCLESFCPPKIKICPFSIEIKFFSNLFFYLEFILAQEEGMLLYSSPLLPAQMLSNQTIKEYPFFPVHLKWNLCLNCRSPCIRNYFWPHHHRQFSVLLSPGGQVSPEYCNLRLKRGNNCVIL